MAPKFNKVHNKFKYNGIHYKYNELKDLAYSLIKEGESYEKEIGNFLTDWLNKKSHISVKTSGSTGFPKTIKLQKQSMVNSAIATGDYFNLVSGDTALGCLPIKYIAGKMMLVRAIVLGLEIDMVKPTSQPVFDEDKPYDFCAMVPLQVGNILDKTENIKTIIIGGSRIPMKVLERLESGKSKYYETYGMTETITHVAVKQLESKASNGEPYFSALPNVKFQIDNRNCLIIDAPKLKVENLVTNDVVELFSDQKFELLGRHDNVVNSGGVKLYPEQIEKKLQSILNQRFIVAGEEDSELGERLILIVENPSKSIAEIKSQIDNLEELDKFEIPKAIYSINKFEETASGKIQRTKSIKTAKR
ncbi:AMP-binding protein [Winogradskyella ursingii]|uniref:AMP-binding protein n=1 Tax=Winogradskyella ursingii TaxID=2686079 RepID=UPI0015CC8E9C|nr:AMP-binding protein [Winogradskyella ursingii]